MNYNKIEKLRVDNKFSKTEIAGRLGMTLNGYDKMIQSNSMKVETLEKIAKVFKLPISYFFDEPENSSQVSEMQSEYKTKTKDLTEKLMESKEEQIRLLKEQVEFMKKIIQKN